MCPMLPNPNFLVSEVELPKDKHIKNPEPLILVLRRKVHFLFSPDEENIFLRFSAILGVEKFEIPKFLFLKITFGLVPIGGYNKHFLAGQPIQS